MKRILLITFFMISIISLTACRETTKEEEFNDIQKTFSTIKNYKATVDITVTANKGTESFKAKHVFERPDKYISEIIEPKNNKGNKTIYNGERAYLYNKRVDQYSILKDIKYSEEKMLFLGYFLKNLNNVGELDIYKENIDKIEYLVIGIELPGNNIHRTYEKMWINTKTHLPHKLIIYNDKDKETVNIKYKDIKYNLDIEKDTFKIN